MGQAPAEPRRRPLQIVVSTRCTASLQRAGGLRHPSDPIAGRQPTAVKGVLPNRMGNRACLLGMMLTFLALPSRASADEPNLFEPRLMSSGSIAAMLQGCLESSARSMPGWTLPIRQRYCSCFSDATRQATRRARAPVTQPVTPTWNQLRGCAQWAQESSVFAGRTPHDGTPLNSWAINLLLESCWRLNDLPPRERVIFCGCFADAIRSHGDRPSVAPEEDAFCRAAARQVVATHRYPPPFRRPPRRRR